MEPQSKNVVLIPPLLCPGDLVMLLQFLRYFCLRRRKKSSRQSHRMRWLKQSIGNFLGVFVQLSEDLVRKDYARTQCSPSMKNDNFLPSDQGISSMIFMITNKTF
jgi:hypothetical protein